MTNRIREWLDPDDDDWSEPTEAELSSYDSGYRDGYDSGCRDKLLWALTLLDTGNASAARLAIESELRRLDGVEGDDD